MATFGGERVMQSTRRDTEWLKLEDADGQLLHDADIEALTVNRR